MKDPKTVNKAAEGDGAADASEAEGSAKAGSDEKAGAGEGGKAAVDEEKAQAASVRERVKRTEAVLDKMYSRTLAETDDKGSSDDGKTVNKKSPSDKGTEGDGEKKGDSDGKKKAADEGGEQAGFDKKLLDRASQLGVSADDLQRMGFKSAEELDRAFVLADRGIVSVGRRMQEESERKRKAAAEHSAQAEKDKSVDKGGSQVDVSDEKPEKKPVVEKLPQLDPGKWDEEIVAVTSGISEGQVRIREAQGKADDRLVSAEKLLKKVQKESEELATRLDEQDAAHEFEMFDTCVESLGPAGEDFFGKQPEGEWDRESEHYKNRKKLLQNIRIHYLGLSQLGIKPLPRYKEVFQREKNALLGVSATSTEKTTREAREKIDKEIKATEDLTISRPSAGEKQESEGEDRPRADRVKAAGRVLGKIFPSLRPKY